MRAKTILFLSVLSALILFMGGCKAKTVFVPVDRLRVEYKDRFRVDSVYNRDTLKIFTRNDTVYNTEIKWREKFVIDTISVLRIDSISYPVTVEVPVNFLTKWQKLRLTILNIMAGLLFAYLAFKIGVKLK